MIDNGNIPVAPTPQIVHLLELQVLQLYVDIYNKITYPMIFLVLLLHCRKYCRMKSV